MMKIIYYLNLFIVCYTAYIIQNLPIKYKSNNLIELPIFIKTRNCKIIWEGKFIK